MRLNDLKVIWRSVRRHESKGREALVIVVPISSELLHDGDPDGLARVVGDAARRKAEASVRFMLSEGRWPGRQR